MNSNFELGIELDNITMNLAFGLALFSGLNFEFVLCWPLTESVIVRQHSNTSFHQQDLTYVFQRCLVHWANLWYTTHCFRVEIQPPLSTAVSPFLKIYESESLSHRVYGQRVNKWTRDSSGCKVKNRVLNVVYAY